MTINGRERQAFEQRADRGTPLGADRVLQRAMGDQPSDELAARRSGWTRRRVLAAAAVLVAGCTVGAAVWLANSGQQSDTTIAAIDCVRGRGLVVYVDPDATPRDIAVLEVGLMDDPAVAGVRYVEETATYEEFRRLFEGQAEMLENVDARDLPTSFRVEVTDGEDLDQVAERWRTVESVFEVSVAADAGPRCGRPPQEADDGPHTVGTTSQPPGEDEVGETEQSPWIVERVQDQAGSDQSPGAGPQYEGPDDTTRMLLGEFQTHAGEGFTVGSQGRFIGADGSVAHVGQLVRGAERLSFTTQQLTLPLQILPEEGSPLQETGTYSQDPDGTEILIVDTHRALGSSNPSDRQIYVVEPSGRMTEIGYRGVGEESGTATDQENWLIELGRQMNKLDGGST